MSDFLRQGCRCGLCRLCRREKLFLDPVIVCRHSARRQRLNTPDTGRNPRLRENFKRHNRAGICDMRTAAELDGKITHFNNTHTLTVFFPEKSHCACLSGLLKAHNLRHNRQRGGNFLIYNCLH